MKIFLSGTSFRPEYGGPARSVAMLARSLVATGVEVAVWAPDGSAVGSPFLPDGSGVQCLSGAPSEALDEAGGADLIHDNGVWLPHNHKLALLGHTRGIPRLVSTRGMLEPWALHHKRWKKRVAWWLYQRSDLLSAGAYHATCEREAVQLQQLLGRNRQVAVIPNGVSVDGIIADPRAEGGRRIVLFVGRIHPVKGLPMLVEAWNQVRPCGWGMRIVGPDEAGHRADVERLARAAGVADDFEFCGALEGAQLEQIYAMAELLVLPSHTENFGMVVAEALARGIPVIASQGTPWQGLLEYGCGWWPQTSVAGLAEALRDATLRETVELKVIGDRGRAWMERDFTWKAVAKNFVGSYEQLLSKACGMA